MPPQKIPSPQGRFLAGHLPEFRRDPLAAMSRWQRDYGDLVAFRLGPRPFYLLSHPDLAEQALVVETDIFVKMYEPDRPKGLQLVLGQGLVTSKGDLWQRQRRLMQPVFQRRNIHNMLPLMVQAGRQWLDRWHDFESGAEVDVSAEMLRLMLEVLTRTMFGTSVLGEVDSIAPALDTCLRYAAQTMMKPLSPPLWVPTPANRAFRKALTTLDDVIYRIIEQRRQKGQLHDDLLARLLAAADDDSGKGMSARQLRDEMITLFTAGHETTATLMTWTLYWLARHPDEAKRLRTELRVVLNGCVADSEQLERLDYAKAVLMEVMRLRPPAALVIRKLTRDTAMAGYTLKAGSLAMVSIYNIHHHPALWPNPETFDPDRFYRQKIPKHHFLPFGMGPRFCIGSHFAMVESVLLLSMLVQHFDFSLASEQEPEIDMGVTIRPKGGLRLKVRPVIDPAPAG